MQIARQHRLIIFVFIAIIAFAVLMISFMAGKKTVAGEQNTVLASSKENFEWQAPDTAQLSFTAEDMLIRYGRDLIANTSFYLGPRGKLSAITNGMNCQNCHLDAGTRLWGNNYSAVYSTYPRFRERSGTIENIYKRVNDCIERSLNGKHGLDTTSREMQAITKYIKWLGQNVPKNVKPSGVGIKDLPFLNRAADPEKGRMIYIQNCQRCHGVNGEGVLNIDSGRFLYPPLWGRNSYTTAAGLYRLSRFAGYVRYNMPFDAPSNARQLTDEEAWDVAAFVNTQPRPEKKYKNDWPNVAGKPVDYPFGPYADSFTETQHKYGPFEPIQMKKKKTDQPK